MVVQGLTIPNKRKLVMYDYLVWKQKAQFYFDHYLKLSNLDAKQRLMGTIPDLPPNLYRSAVCFITHLTQ
jgi:hypothetical protein